MHSGKVWKQKGSRRRMPFEVWSYTVSSQRSMRVSKPEAGRQTWHTPFPVTFRGSTALRTPWPRVPSLQDWETIHLCCLLPLKSVGLCSSTPRKLIQGAIYWGSSEIPALGLQDFKTSHCAGHFHSQQSSERISLQTSQGLQASFKPHS